MKRIAILFKSILLFPLYLCKYIILIFFYQIYLILRYVNPLIILDKTKNLNRKPYLIILRHLSGLLFALLIITPLWNIGYILLKNNVYQILGFNPERIMVSGTGSMYPTFPKGEGKSAIELSKEVVSMQGMFPYPNGFVFKGVRYLGYDLQRGDIVVVENETIRKITEEIYGDPSGWVKRLIGLPGDTIELREGLLYLNKVPQKEQYTAQPHSTFGQAFLEECREVVVPKNTIFVMGDNRKGSGDSREVGFISIDSVSHVLPISSQIGILDTNWRNTDLDLEDSSKIKIDKSNYLKLINEKRTEHGVPKLKYDKRLENSARKRADVILKYDDLSFEATKSGYTMKKAIADSNYSNIVIGEVPRYGYYEAQELIENQFEFAQSKEFLLEADFDEIGIAEVEGQVNGCPTQVVVLHFGGYIPPNYSAEEIQAWQNIIYNLKNVQPGWQKLIEFTDFYNKHKVEIDRINEVITIRIRNSEVIVTKMEANEWLSDIEKKFIEEDNNLFMEQENLAEKINQFIIEYN